MIAKGDSPLPYVTRLDEFRTIGIALIQSSAILGVIETEHLNSRSKTLPCATILAIRPSTTRCRLQMCCFKPGTAPSSDRLHWTMEGWFRRKGFLKADERLSLSEVAQTLIDPNGNKVH
jgi:hypothetical protein